MKTVGIVGGIAPESTIEYYRLLIKSYRARTSDGSYPPIIINSIDLQKMISMIAANELTAVTEYLVSEARKLAQAGADFGLFASNTPHLVFDEINRQSPIPLISIVEATCAAATAQGLRKLGLFGTRFTMQGHSYPDVFTRAEIAVVSPEAAEQDYIHDIYMKELVEGIFKDETRARLLQIVDRLKEREGIDGLILGGTELPLILHEVDERGIPFLDTTRIHVAAIIAEMFS
jgi:aspartate racemase